MFIKSLLSMLVAALVFLWAADVSAQKRNPKPDVEKKPIETASTDKVPVGVITPQIIDPGPAKKNARMNGPESDTTVNSQKKEFTHFYEFSQPEFIISRIEIRHDDRGRGEISFTKKGANEIFTDPIQLTEVTLEKIRTALTEMDFINSNENYQHERDFSHLGTIKYSLASKGRSRTATYNWTSNKAAKALMDEYRRIGHQYIWMFDITVARENQPLDTPRLMNMLDGYLRRGEISDATQMVPFLTGLSNDERIPLIARNHAEKLIKQIEKVKK